MQTDEQQIATFKTLIRNKLLHTVGKDPGHASIHDWYIATALAVRNHVVEPLDRHHPADLYGL